MKLALRFWSHLALWTGILLLLFVGLSVNLNDDGPAKVIAHTPVWGGLALVLSAFPAGLAVSRETTPEQRPSQDRF